LVAPAAGLPLIRSTPNLGRQLVRIKGTVDVDASLTPETKKKRVYWGFKRFVEWMEKEGHEYRGNLVIHGPFPHMNWQQPSIQHGERGAQRKVARPVQGDVEYDKEDYVLEAHFLTREKIQEIPADVGLDVIGKRGVRAVREGTQQG
jgi:hypothetical protein